MHPAWLSLKTLLFPHNASGTQLVPSYEKAFAERVIGADVPTLAFGRGRVALWMILRAANVDDTSEVVIPAYTCETVPMAVKFAGAKCVYADLEAGRYNATCEAVDGVLTKNSKAVICQHTYGILQSLQPWVRLASKNHVLLIEDRCQLLKNGSYGQGSSALGDAAYFSTHFSKPYSTVQGGMAAFSEDELHKAVAQLRDSLSQDDCCKRTRALAAQRLLYDLVVRPATRAIAGNMFRWAQRCGLIRGTISTDEYGDTMPSDYLSRATDFQAILGNRELSNWRENHEHRKSLTQFYLERLGLLGVDTDAFKDVDPVPVLLMVPLLVRNKEELLSRAAWRALPIGTWFDRCPAHIRPQTAHLYDYVPGQCPRTERMISMEIHLLTAPWVSLSQAKRAIRFIERFANMAGHREQQLASTVSQHP